MAEAPGEYVLIAVNNYLLKIKKRSLLGRDFSVNVDTFYVFEDNIDGVWVDKEENVWLSVAKYSDGGLLYLFDAVKGAWKNVKLGTPAMPGILNKIIQDKENSCLWVSGNTGLSKLQGRTWACIDDFTGKDVRDVCLDDQNLLWVLSEKATISRFYKNQWQHFNLEERMQETIGSIYPADDKVWLVSDNVLYEFNPSRQLKEYTLPSSDGNTYHPEKFQFLFEDHHGVISIITYDGYVSKKFYRLKDTIFVKNEAVSSFIDAKYSSKRIKGVMNYDNKLWFCHTQGLFSYDGNSIVSHDTPYYHDLYSVSVDVNGTKWFNSKNSVLSWKDGVWKRYISMPYLISETFINDNGLRWGIGKNGLFEFE